MGATKGRMIMEANCIIGHMNVEFVMKARERERES